METKRLASQGVVKGVLILTAASLFVKFVGIFYKVPLTYILGDEGMGYFNAAYTIYAWLYMLSTAGIPVALSIMISESVANQRRDQMQAVVRIATRALLIIGVLSCSIMLLGAGTLARFLGTEDAKYTIYAIAPTLFFICVSALFRGIFQGHRNMLPTAMSQLIEAVGKVVFGILFAWLAQRRGFTLPLVSAFAVCGVTIGTAFGAGYLLLHYIIARARGQIVSTSVLIISTAKPKVGRRLLSIAIPVTISASVMSLTGLIDLGMIIRRLVSVGYTQAEATALYGNYTTLVVPLFNLPSVIVSPIATGIIPAVSAARACGLRETWESMVKSTFKVVGVIAVPCAIGFAVFSRPILALVYPSESVQTAYTLLSVVSPAVFFLCTLTVANAVMQACNMSRLSMLSMLFGGSVKIISGYFLLGKMGVIGSPLGTVLCYVTALTISLFWIGTKLNLFPSVGDMILKPLLASFFSIGSVALLYYYLLVDFSPKIGILICILLAIGAYLGVSLVTGCFTKEELGQMLKQSKKSPKKTFE